MKILGLITARGGSKGLPGKNVALVAGRPLVAWTVEAALASGRLHRTIVSTDDPAIADICRAHGVEAPFLRPTELARDDSPHQPVLEHAVRWLMKNEDWTPEIVVLLQPTSPLRNAADIDGAVELLLRSKAPSVASITATRTHPYLVRSMDAQGRLTPSVEIPSGYLRRQDFPPVFELNGAVYVIRTEALLAGEPLVGPETLGFMMPTERSLDIDDPADLKTAERTLCAQGKGCNS
jgi:CMP-N,N'-diacetyllegionaminic acid synthase